LLRDGDRSNVEKQKADRYEKKKDLNQNHHQLASTNKNKYRTQLKQKLEFSIIQFVLFQSVPIY
jgi:hypothetical protein